jgi:hypothetical protein
MTPSARIASWMSGYRYSAGRPSEAAGPVVPEHKRPQGRRIVRALRVLHGYRPAVAVLGRSSIRTWLNSVLSLCAPHWGQRSADDHAPHRGHALCLRFGTTALPVHRCRISRFLEHPNEVAPQASRLVLATEFGAYRGRRNIIDQFHPNWKPRRYSPPPSFGSRVPGAAAGRHLPPGRGSWPTGRSRMLARTALSSNNRLTPSTSVGESEPDCDVDDSVARHLRPHSQRRISSVRVASNWSIFNEHSKTGRMV